jgi:hypothetical protein
MESANFTLAPRSIGRSGKQALDDSDSFRTSSESVNPQYFNSYEDRLQTYIARKLSEVPEVESIYCLRNELTYFVWVVIGEYDPEVRRRIYVKQKEVVRVFHEEEFDFYVIARKGQPLDMIIHQEGVERIFQKVW